VFPDTGWTFWPEPGPKLFEARTILAKNGFLADAILQAGEVRVELMAAFIGQAIDHPIRTAFDLHHPVPLQIREVPGNFDLGFAENFLEVTDTERPVEKEMDNAQPRQVAETLVNTNKVHVSSKHTGKRIYVNTHILCSDTIISGAINWLSNWLVKIVCCGIMLTWKGNSIGTM
jgi:hypothetical protein